MISGVLTKRVFSAFLQMPRLAACGRDCTWVPPLPLSVLKMSLCSHSLSFASRNTKIDVRIDFQEYGAATQLLLSAFCLLAATRP